jgi:fucose 4-O-acetylase-like acetyltransferase
MNKVYLPFVDWMKCLGITLIVYGHVSSTADHLIPPIYPKQLGVAFFLFATGYALARETRPRAEVLFKRLFEVYLFGVAFALLMSAITYARIGDLNESNYLPFLLGVNVAFDNFPANPTTWYIGTYIHVLLLWSFAPRGLRIRPWMLAASGITEILIRAFLVETAGLFVAYMVFPNWATVFLMGMFYGQRPEDEGTGPAPYLLGLALLVIGWRTVLGPTVAAYSGPFMRLTVGHWLADLGVTSASVTLLYTAFTWLVYQATRRAPVTIAARFLARNTLIIFIVHMPIHYALSGPLARWTDDYGVRVGAQMVACLLLPAVASEAICRMVRPRRLRDRLWQRLRGERLGRPRRVSEGRPTGVIS